MPDITALGAAMAAGHAEGVDIWELEGEEIETVSTDTFLPTTTPEGRKFKNNLNYFHKYYIISIRYYCCRKRCQI